MKRLAAVVAAALALAAAEDWLQAVQWRFMLLHPAAWLALGALAARVPPRPRAARWDSSGAGAAALLGGTLAFWMLPRSVDAAVLQRGLDWLQHANLLAAGFLFARAFPRMPFLLRGALVIYAVAMLLALSFVFSSWRELLCGSFDLEQQREAARMLLIAAALVLALLVGSGARALARPSGAPATPPAQ